MSPPVPALEISDLRFRYAAGAVNGVDAWVIDLPHIALGAGEQMLLTGSSGRGKSTLLYLIAGLMEPNAGTIRVAGQDIHALSGERRDLFRGRHIGMIFQTFNLLQGFSALENIMAALMFSTIPPREHKDRAMKLLDELGINQPNARAENLSIGQQQRVAVARAMACEPVLVLADEPTASLDPENAEAAMDLIQRTCEAHGAALLCTSHDPTMKARFERQESLETSKRPNAQTSK